MKDSKNDHLREADPPPYPHPLEASTSQSKEDGESDKTSSHGVQLHVAGTRFSLGEIVPFSISVDASALSSLAEEATVVLEGFSTITVMGKLRWQVSATLPMSTSKIDSPTLPQAARAVHNVGGMGPGTLATAIESHTFASSSMTIPLKGGKTDIPGVQASQGEGGVLKWDINSLSIPTSRSCTCFHDNPRPAPTLKSGMGPLAQPLAAVRWRVRVLIKRKGVLRRNIKYLILSFTLGCI